MKLKEKVNADYIKAFKEKNTIVKNLLSVVKGEIQNVEKLPSNDKDWGLLKNSEGILDEGIIKILNKTAKSLKEVNDEESKLQLLIVESYLPKQMSKEEITTKVTNLVKSGIINIGSIMKEFSNLPVDKKLVSEVIREVNK
jgi:uncharacterized protein YqeY